MMTRQRLLTTLSLILLTILCLVACSPKKTVAPITEKSSASSKKTDKSKTSLSKSSSSKSSSSQKDSSAESSSTSKPSATPSSKVSATSTTTTSSSSSKASSSKSSSSSATKGSSSKPASSETKPSHTVVSLPAEAVGTWKGSTAQASSVTLTISPDGSFHVVCDFSDTYKVDETLAVGKLELIAPNVYHIVEHSGGTAALLPGVTGLGGAGTKTTHGFTIQNGQYSPLMWSAPTNEDFDFSQRNTFGVTLTKE